VISKRWCTVIYRERRDEKSLFFIFVKKLTLFLCGFLALSGFTQATELPLLHPKVGSPLLQDFMGGCSLRCAFFWETLAGKPPAPLKPVSELCDDDAMTAWLALTQGAGELIEFRLPKHLPHACRDTPFYGISIANGIVRSLQEFHATARVKTMTLIVNQHPIAQLHLNDTWRWQDFSFPDIFLNEGDIISLSIDELYPGKDSQQPAITEIVLQGAH
jgi:hypothetical protein